ncbi:hypothetical protein [Peptacetobacter sp.]|uniref:hypothetical protein n=1 Tax=Peptacetobacter sp. TaxID=2991975 RepID=UPI002612DA4F|nr:hypothetical protein [Peptacetobacter sp.]
MKYKTINIKNGGYLESIEGNPDWYFCKKYNDNFLDLFEAEEIIKSGNKFDGNNVYLVHYPDGKVFNLFERRENIYIERPVYSKGKIYFLEVDFNKNTMILNSFKCDDILSSYDLNSIKKIETEISLSEIEDCYNLLLEIEPIMIVRCPNNGTFEIIYPERKTYKIENEESFVFRDYDDMYFSKWVEEPEYKEFIILRDFHTGEKREVYCGDIFRMPNGEIWKIK